jgi:hypothetical protein
VPEIDRRTGKCCTALRRVLDGKLDRQRNALGDAREVAEARADVAPDDSALAEDVRTVRAVARIRSGGFLRDRLTVSGRGAAGRPRRGPRRASFGSTAKRAAADEREETRAETRVLEELDHLAAVQHGLEVEGQALVEDLLGGFANGRPRYVAV